MRATLIKRHFGLHLEKWFVSSSSIYVSKYWHVVIVPLPTQRQQRWTHSSTSRYLAPAATSAMWWCTSPSSMRLSQTAARRNRCSPSALRCMRFPTQLQEWRPTLWPNRYITCRWTLTCTAYTFTVMHQTHARTHTHTEKGRDVSRLHCLPFKNLLNWFQLKFEMQMWSTMHIFLLSQYNLRFLCDWTQFLYTL